MLEARSFVKEIETARKILETHEAIFKGEYICKDFIYRSKDPHVSLGNEFLRLRINEKNIWEEKDVIVAIKRTELREVGKNSVIPTRKEFDREEEGRAYIDEHLAGEFVFDFQFTRTGWQYNMGDDQVDLERVEDIPGCYTIEVKSKTDEGLTKLVTLFNLPEPIQGPSVVAMKDLLSVH